MDHKWIRSKDENDLGNLIANYEKYITLQGKRIYKIPMECINMYNGNELFLSINYDELYKYKTLW